MLNETDMLKIITDQQAINSRRRLTALARGKWIVAHDCDTKEEVFVGLKNAIVNKVATNIPNTQ